MAGEVIISTRVIKNPINNHKSTKYSSELCVNQDPEDQADDNFGKFNKLSSIDRADNGKHRILMQQMAAKRLRTFSDTNQLTQFPPEVAPDTINTPSKDYNPLNIKAPVLESPPPLNVDNEGKGFDWEQLLDLLSQVVKLVYDIRSKQNGLFIKLAFQARDNSFQAAKNEYQHEMSQAIGALVGGVIHMGFAIGALASALRSMVKNAKTMEAEGVKETKKPGIGKSNTSSQTETPQQKVTNPSAKSAENARTAKLDQERVDTARAENQRVDKNLQRKRKNSQEDARKENIETKKKKEEVPASSVNFADIILAAGQALDVISSASGKIDGAEYGKQAAIDRAVAELKKSLEHTTGQLDQQLQETLLKIAELFAQVIHTLSQGAQDIVRKP